MLRRTLKHGLLLIAMMLIASVVWAGGSKELKEDLRIGNFWTNYDVATEKPTDENGELVLEWRKRVQTEHGIKISERMVGDWGSMLQTITTSVMAGRPAAQAFHVTPDWAMSLIRQRLLAPISDSKVVNFTTTTAIPYRQAVYNQDIAKLFTFNNKFYAICFGYGNSRHSSGVYFNKRLFREAGLAPDLPYDMQKAGTWTWDAFVDLCQKLTRDTNNTGRIDTYAMTADISDAILTAFVFSNGAQYVDKDASGKFVNATDRADFLEALQFCKRLNEIGVMMPRPDGSNWDWYFSAFHDGQVAMMVEAEWRCGSLSTMTDDWGYVLAPKGPKATDYRFPTDENVIVIPSQYKGEELDTIVQALNWWYMPVNDDWKAGLWSSYRDTRAVDETMTMIRGPRYGVFTNQMMIPGLQIGDIAWQMWWFDGDPAQLVEQVSQNWNALIADANNISL